MGNAPTNVNAGMKVAITDASVFFDLYKIELLPEFFGLDIEIYTTDFIFNEILQSDERSLFETFCRSNKLKIIVIDETEREKISEMNLCFGNKSLADRTAIFKAKQMDCILLTCDKKLTKEAKRQGIEVHGSIWIVCQLLENKKLEPDIAIDRLELLKETNSWLPLEAINNVINNLKGLR
jgi:rRNA-processing protein FCF1